MRVSWIRGGLAGLLAATAIAVVAGQPQRPSATLDDVLREIRGLRADLAQQSAAALQVQALVARVSLQEQRLKALSLQASDAAEATVSAARARESHEQHLAEFDTLLGRGELPRGLTREQLESEVEFGKQELARLREQETASRARADELAGLLMAEESRWFELNGRLDALEIR